MSDPAGLRDLLTPDRVFPVPLTIGVISDTHIYAGSRRQIHPAIYRMFRRARVGLLVHLGDANSASVLEELAGIAPLIALPGNNDDWDLQELLPESVDFRVGRFSFGALHGHMGRTARDMALRTFGDRKDVILFGHSHKPLIERVGRSILFNPGSATDRRWFEHFGIGLIRVDDERIDPELILYTHPAHLDNVLASPDAGNA